MRLEYADDIGILRMEAGKGNAMGAAFLKDLTRLFDDLEKSPAKGVVLTGYESFFSVGLSLPELMPLSRNEVRDFLREMACTMGRLLAFPRPIVAAVNGHAVAGGCVLALHCDYRVASAGPSRIGLSEVQIGLGLPGFVVEILRQAVHHPADWVEVAHRGRLMSPKEAQSAGLVDEVVLDDQVEFNALHRAQLLAEVPSLAFAQVKKEYRRAAVSGMLVDASEREEAWLDTWFSDEAQALLKKAVARLGP